MQTDFGCALYTFCVPHHCKERLKLWLNDEELFQTNKTFVEKWTCSPEISIMRTTKMRCHEKQFATKETSVAIYDNVTHKSTGTTSSLTITI